MEISCITDTSSPWQLQWSATAATVHYYSDRAQYITKSGDKSLEICEITVTSVFDASDRRNCRCAGPWGSSKQYFLKQDSSICHPGGMRTPRSEIYGHRSSVDVGRQFNTLISEMWKILMVEAYSETWVVLENPVHCQALPAEQ